MIITLHTDKFPNTRLAREFLEQALRAAGWTVDAFNTAIYIQPWGVGAVIRISKNRKRIIRKLKAIIPDATFHFEGDPVPLAKVPEASPQLFTLKEE